MGKMDFVQRAFFRPINMRLHDLSPEPYAVSNASLGSVRAGFKKRACVHRELPAVQGRRRRLNDYCLLYRPFKLRSKEDADGAAALRVPSHLVALK